MSKKGLVTRIFYILGYFWGDLLFFSWGFFFLAGTYRGKKWGIFFKFIFFPFYIYTYYHKADRWGRLVGGKFPIPVCHYNTQLDTGRSPPFFSQNLISVSICCICILLQKWWNCWAAIPLFLEQKVDDVCSQ